MTLIRVSAPLAAVPRTDVPMTYTALDEYIANDGMKFKDSYD